MKMLALYSRLFAVLSLVLGLGGCDRPPSLNAIQVIPSASALTFGGTVQFKAIGSYQNGTHPVINRDVTGLVTWASSNTNVSTITAAGLANAVSTGSTTITASLDAMVGTAIVAVSTEPPHDLTSITVIPSSQPVTSIGEPTQFIAIGTFTTVPITVDITNTVSWQSSDVKVATISSAGLALANSAGSTTITAIGTSNSGSSIAGTSGLTVGGAAGGVVLPQLTVYQVGLGIGTVTSADGVINCTTIGGAACTGNFVLGTTVTLTAAPSPGSTFGGWSTNCVPDTEPTCSIVMNNNEPVGAIFNTP
jgi:Bacterial Ig-like domain (group 2)/Divergent InlB B-repeat domain